MENGLLPLSLENGLLLVMIFLLLIAAAVWIVTAHRYKKEKFLDHEEFKMPEGTGLKKYFLYKDKGYYFVAKTSRCKSLGILCGEILGYETWAYAGTTDGWGRGDIKSLIDESRIVVYSRKLYPNTRIQFVRAKFVCVQAVEHIGQNSKTFIFNAVTDGSEENKSFATYTTSGQLELLVDLSSSARTFFSPGVEYYLDFSKASTNHELHENEV